jgi:hypothetical protein
MGPLAVFGITNDGLNLAVNLLLLFLVVMYFALVWWTYSDARRRIEDPMIVACATAASMFPFLGTVVYLIVRPPEYLEDVRERDLEIAAAQARLQSLEHPHCQYCGFEVEKSFLRCPSCLRRLKEPCNVCGKPLDPRWKICPYCESEVGQAPPETRRARPRRTAAAAAAGGAAAVPRAARPAQAARQPRPAEEAPAERPARARRDRPQSAG